MKTLLASTALALVAMSGAASAQSVLERVLTSINDTNSNIDGSYLHCLVFLVFLTDANLYLY